MIAWFIVPYKRRTDPRIVFPTRYCSIDDFTDEIKASGGDWSETEVLGNRAIVKVRAAVETIAKLDLIYKRLPKDNLDTPLSDLSANAKQKLKNELLDMGYSLAEVKQKFPNDLGTYTLRDILKFAASRRLKPRYDKATDTIILDGIEEPCKSIEIIDERIK